MRAHERDREAEARQRGPAVAFETGGEDTPGACRWVPAKPSEGRLNCVAVFEPRRGADVYQKMFSQVFDKATAAFNFHSMQRIIMAICRRWLLVLMFMCYDDVSLQDLAAAAASGVYKASFRC